MKKSVKMLTVLTMCLMTLVLSLSFAACNAQCGQQAGMDGVEYMLCDDGKSYGVVGFTSKGAKEVHVLSEYKGKPVTTVLERAFAESNVVKVHLPDSITKIGKRAFADCIWLREVVMPRNLSEIEEYAFSGCDRLYKIEKGIYYVENWVVGADLDIDILYFDTKTVGIADKALFGCANLKEINLFANIKYIGREAFSACSNLKAVPMGYNIERIGERAFENCISLSSVKISDKVTTLPYKVFFNCTSLTSVNIPDSVTSIGDYAFENCGSLTSITIPNGVPNIELRMFANCSSLKSVTIPRSITLIKAQAFYNCSNLKIVNYKGSTEEWKFIYIDSDNDYLKNAKINYIK